MKGYRSVKDTWLSFLGLNSVWQLQPIICSTNSSVVVFKQSSFIAEKRTMNYSCPVLLLLHIIRTDNARGEKSHVPQNALVTSVSDSFSVFSAIQSQGMILQFSVYLSSLKIKGNVHQNPVLMYTNAIIFFMYKVSQLLFPQCSQSSMTLLL